MGFTAGFTGGVTLTLSIAYLFVHTNQNNRVQQSLALRTSTYALTSALEPTAPPPPPLSRLEAATAIRPGLSVELKEKWNHELTAAVRKVQHTDWEAVRDSCEASLMRMWHGPEWKPAFSPESWAQAAASSVQQAAIQARQDVHDAAMAVDKKAEDANAAAGDEAESLAKRLRSGYEQARESVQVGLDDLSDKAQGAVATAKANVHLAEERLEGMVERKIIHANDVERALQQRYEEGVSDRQMQKSVDEVLKERYKPVDEKKGGEFKGM